MSNYMLLSTIIVALCLAACAVNTMPPETTTNVDKGEMAGNAMKPYWSSKKETIGQDTVLASMEVSFDDSKQIKTEVINGSGILMVYLHDFKQALTITKDLTREECYLRGFDKGEFFEDYWATKKRHENLTMEVAVQSQMESWRKGKSLNNCVLQALSAEASQLCANMKVYWLESTSDAFDISAQSDAGIPEGLGDGHETHQRKKRCCNVICWYRGRRHCCCYA